MDEPSSNLPVPRGALDRAALERVLARAAELQASEGDRPEVLSEQQLIDIGKEVGLSPQHLRQAIAEERTRVAIPTEHGKLAGYFGPAMIGASRVVRGTVASTLPRLDRWMDKEECLQVKRRFPDRMTWEPRRDFLGNIRRGFNIGGRGYALSSGYEVGATLTQVDEQHVLVQLTADMSSSRKRAVRNAAVMGGTLGTGAALVAGTAVTFGGSLLVAGVIGGALLLMGGGSAALAAKASRELLMRAQLSLEQVLDTLEHPNEPPRSVIGTILGAAIREPK